LAYPSIFFFLIIVATIQSNNNKKLQCSVWELSIL
jgi:hypothetical protein